MAAPSWQEYFNDGRAEAINRRPDLTFDDGDISEMYVAGMAAMADHLTGYFANRFRATYLDGAQGDDLTTLADDHWNIQRIAATSAVGVVSFSRTNANGALAGVQHAGDIVATTKAADGSEIQYTLDADLNWTLAELGPKTANVTATLTGAASDSAVNTITRILTTPFDTAITVSNPSSQMAGGADEETDDALRERVRSFPATLRRGTIAALEYAATTIPGVATSTAIEEVDSFNVPTGVVDLYISDSSGNSSPPLLAAVALEIINWRAAGIIVNVTGGLLQTQDIAVVLTVRLGTNTLALIPNVQAAIAARVNKLKIGETLSPDIIRQATLNVDDNILSVVVTNPGAAVVPPAGTLIRAGIVTVS